MMYKQAKAIEYIFVSVSQTQFWIPIIILIINITANVTIHIFKHKLIIMELKLLFVVRLVEETILELKH